MKKHILGSAFQLLIGTCLGAQLFACSGQGAAFEGSEFEDSKFEGTEDLTEADVSELGEELIARTDGTRYPSGNNLNVDIKLCWDASSWADGDKLKFAQGADLWEAAVRETWFGQEARLTLDVDDECDSSHTKIGITTGRPATGTTAPDANFKFTNLSQAACNADTTSWTKCVKMFAVRSMGYYLGFGDEESATGEGNNVVCPDGHQETVRAEGDTSMSSPNGPSVMSLCHAFPKTDNYQLSSGDITGLKAAYGAGGAVVSGNRYALRFTTSMGNTWKGKYLSSQSWTGESKIRAFLISDPNVANVFTFSFVSGSSALETGETIRLFRPDGKALCLMGPCTSPGGCPVPVWTTGTTNAGCTWTATVLGGGSTVHGSDPVRLRVDVPAGGGPTSPNSAQIDVRFVGPLPQPASGQ